MRKNDQTTVILVVSLLGLATGGYTLCARPAGVPTYTTTRYALTIGKECQMVTALQGGAAVGTVAEIKPTGEKGAAKKHISGITYEPIQARIAPAYFTPFISGSLEESLGPVNGSISYLDGNGKLALRRDISNMVLTELEFPKLHRWGKAPSDLELVMTLQAQETRIVVPAAGEAAPTPTPLSAARQKPWQGAWRLTIPDIDTLNTTYIEPFTIRRKIAPADPNSTRTFEPVPDRWEIPNFAFYLPPWLGEQAVKWHEDFAINGNNGDDREKTLVIELLDADGKPGILRLEGSGVGIISAKHEQDIAPNANTTAGYRIELYVENLKIVDPTATTVKTRTFPNDVQPAR
jgi:hypothetical protein